ncbi:hypothetical protein CI610_03474 [invertebrate metagenome]|uniref:Uncharacterized protein n=1 Tax=invertebrate metagenome TaxID=1711999 RepID=A0A2H9T301_9ZZZZ
MIYNHKLFIILNVRLPCTVYDSTQEKQTKSRMPILQSYSRSRPRHFMLENKKINKNKWEMDSHTFVTKVEQNAYLLINFCQFTEIWTNKKKSESRIRLSSGYRNVYMCTNITYFRLVHFFLHILQISCRRQIRRSYFRPAKRFVRCDR